MRHGRAKQARKTLQFFARISNGALGGGGNSQHNNKKKHPYSILLDGTFLVALVQYKLQTEILDRLDRLLQHATLHLYTTRSTINELQQLEQATTTSSKKRKSSSKSIKSNSADDDDKAAMFRQARTWAETHCTRILEEEDIPDERAVDISSIPTTPASVREGSNYNKRKANSRKADGGSSGSSSSSSDLSPVGRDILRLVMGVLVVDQDEKEKDAKEKSESHHGERNDEAKSSNNNRHSNNNHRRSTGSAGSQYRKRWYFVASQDEQVLDRLRHLGHVPIIRLARGSVLLLEQPSKAATQQAWNEERQKWRLGSGSTGGGGGGRGGGTSSGKATTTGSASMLLLQQERNEAKRLRQEERAERRREQQEQQPYPARRKKRAKGPNPLSCKSTKKQKR